jgi:hypothetical protein
MNDRHLTGGKTPYNGTNTALSKHAGSEDSRGMSRRDVFVLEINPVENITESNTDCTAADIGDAV